MIPGEITFVAANPNVPRTRGDDPTLQNVIGDSIGMFPAHAGMIPSDSLVNQAIGDVPRTRGDDPYGRERLYGRSRCSPHTRG